MTTPDLTFPPSAAEPLAAMYRNNQFRAATFLASAARSLACRPAAPLERCHTGQYCLPLRSPESPLCMLCAVDMSVDMSVARFSRGFAESVQDEFRKVGNVAKQAVIDVLEANPGVLDPEREQEQACVMVSSRLHTGNLAAQTVAEIREEAELAQCYRALSRLGPSGRLLSTVTERVEAMLVRRGWAAGGYATPAGRHAYESNERALRRAETARAVAPRGQARP